MLNFRLTDVQQDLRELARDFAQREIAPVAKRYDQTGDFPHDVAAKAYDLGLLNLTIPSEFGGGGLGYLDVALIKEEFAAGCAGINAAIGITGLGVLPVLVAADLEQQRKWLREVTDGVHFVSFAMTETEAGSDVAGVRATARKVGNTYVLNGSKHYITAGTVADWFTVFAYTDPDRGRNGLSVFWVPRHTEGVSVPRKEDMMGQRASNTAEVLMTDATIPSANLIGREGDGLKIARRVFARSRPGVGAGSVGLARSAFEYAFQYAQARRTFGHPISDYQAIQFKLAQMSLKIETARLLTWRSAWAADHGDDTTRWSAYAKLYAADACMEITTEAVQILGGIGYSSDAPLEKAMRDAKLMQIYEGTSEIQHVIIYRDLARAHGASETLSAP